MLSRLLLLLLATVCRHVTRSQSVGTGDVVVKDSDACIATKVHLIQTLDLCVCKVGSQHHGQGTLCIKLEGEESEAEVSGVRACDAYRGGHRTGGGDTGWGGYIIVEGHSSRTGASDVQDNTGTELNTQPNLRWQYILVWPGQ